MTQALHCTMDDLTALRDGEGSAWAREHVAQCATCGAELDLLHQRVAGLKALPPRHPSRDRWPALRAAWREDRGARRRQVAWRVAGFAAAATVAGLLLVRAVTPTTAYADEIALAKQQSAALEAGLAAHDPNGRVVSGREAALCAELEDRIAVIDGVLAQAAREAELLDLWQQRVDLMQQLYTVRATRAAYVGF
jgi:hypothetical protein